MVEKTAASAFFHFGMGREYPLVLTGSVTV